jgi:hypothetical protein
MDLGLHVVTVDSSLIPRLQLTSIESHTLALPIAANIVCVKDGCENIQSITWALKERSTKGEYLGRYCCAWLGGRSQNKPYSIRTSAVAHLRETSREVKAKP